MPGMTKKSIMKNYFQNKVIIITGASSGIGLASAKLFASYGARLSLAARSLDKLEALAKEIGTDNVLCVKTDVSVEEIGRADSQQIRKDRHSCQQCRTFHEGPFPGS